MRLSHTIAALAGSAVTLTLVYAVEKSGFIFGTQHEVLVPPQSQSQAPSRGHRVMVLKADGMGRFWLNADANNIRTRFIVDTGSDYVAFTKEDAAALGIDLNKTTRETFHTANGTITTRTFVLDELDIGSCKLRNVPAAVIENSNMSLLGLSAMGLLGRVEFDHDHMTLWCDSDGQPPFHAPTPHRRRTHSTPKVPKL